MISKWMYRSIASLILFAMLVGLVPAAFASEDNSQELPAGEMLVAELDEDGELVYSEADESTKSAMRSTSFNAQATQSLSKRNRVAYFIDENATETSALYRFQVTSTNIKNLINLGVTDFFVMTKDRNGNFNTTTLRQVISYAGTSANVYAWMHAALDNYFIADNPGSAQYHFRAGRKCNAYSADSTNYNAGIASYVDLGSSAYRAYFKSLVDNVEECSGVDGILLDSVKFGQDTFGWDDSAKEYMGRSVYNEVVINLAKHYGYTYKTDSNGFYIYSSSTASADYTSMETFVQSDSTSAKVYCDYRATVINNFIKYVRSNLSSNLYLGVTVDSEYDGSLYVKSRYGIFPNKYKNIISNGFAVVKTFMDATQNYTGYQIPITIAKSVAKLGCNVFVGMDGIWSNNGNYRYVSQEALYYQSYYIHKARYEINGEISYGGDILGVALYTAGNIGMMKVSLSALSSKPTIEVNFVNPNIKTYGMLSYFHRYNSPNAQFDFSAAGIAPGGLVASQNGSMQYFANNDSASGNGMGYIGAYSSYANATVAAYGKGSFSAPLKGVSVTYETLPFARINLYDSGNSGNTYPYTSIIPMYPNWVVKTHTNCSYKQTVVVAPTCTSDGYSVNTCATCGYDYVQVIAKTGHDYVQEITTAPTCVEEGVCTYTCSTCADTYTSSIPELGHTYEFVITPPNCTTDGYTTYFCSVCEELRIDDPVPAPGHIYEAEVIESSCTTQGYTVYTCASCGDRYVSDEIQALGHSYEAVVTEPTCTDGGYTTYTCAVCGDAYTDEAVAALGHSYTYVDNGDDHTVACENCDYSKNENHTYADNTCVCGATEITEPVYVPNENLINNMSISAGVEMQVMYNVPHSRIKDFESFYIEVVKEVAGGESVTTIFSLENNNLTIVRNDAGEISRYMATYTGVFAMEMGDQFTSTVYAVTEDGTINFGPSVTDSVQSFLMQQLTAEDSPVVLKSLVVDMLNYGAAAQRHFNYDLGNLVNNCLTEEQKAFGTKIIPEAVNGSSTSGSGASIITSVSVQSKVMLYLTFRYRATADSNLKVVIKNTDGKIISEYAPYQINTANCKAIYEDVSARQMRELITIELYDNGVLVTQSVTWSVESYVAQIREDSNSSEALVDAVNMMLAYGDSAAAYLTYTGQ